MDQISNGVLHRMRLKIILPNDFNFFLFLYRITRIQIWFTIWTILQKLFLIAQKKCLDALNAVQKTFALYKIRSLKKTWQTSKNTHCWWKRLKLVIFECFSLYFSETVLCKELGFCVAFSALGRFFWAVKKNLDNFLSFSS